MYFVTVWYGNFCLVNRLMVEAASKTAAQAAALPVALQALGMTMLDFYMLPQRQEDTLVRMLHFYTVKRGEE